MKYIVSRTREHGDGKPCEEAIRQESGTMRWTIDINSLAELNAFVIKYGRLVISPDLYQSQSLEIEIYDGYRE